MSKPNKNKNQVQLDSDLWEKLFLALVITGIFLILGLIIKYSFEEQSFTDVLVKTLKTSEIIFFHMSTASFGAFMFLILLIIIKFRNSVTFSNFSKSLKSYLVFFIVINISIVMFDMYAGYKLISIETYTMSFGFGILTAVIIHFVGKVV